MKSPKKIWLWNAELGKVTSPSVPPEPLLLIVSPVYSVPAPIWVSASSAACSWSKVKFQGIGAVISPQRTNGRVQVLRVNCTSPLIPAAGLIVALSPSALIAVTVKAVGSAPRVITSPTRSSAAVGGGGANLVALPTTLVEPLTTTVPLVRSPTHPVRGGGVTVRLGGTVAGPGTELSRLRCVSSVTEATR